MQSAGAEKRKPLKIGLAGPLSGPRQPYGDLIKQAVASSSWDKLEISLGDDQAKPDAAYALAREFIAWGAEAVVGHFNSECARKAGVLYQNAAIPFLMPAATAPDLCAATGGYRLCAADTRQIEVMAHWLEHTKLSVLDVWSDGSAYGERLKALFTRSGAATQAKANGRVSVLFGAHHHVADQIISRKSSGGAEVFLVPDDCVIDEFIDLISGVEADVIGAKAEPEYYSTVISALSLLQSIAHTDIDISTALATNPRFENGEDRLAAFRLCTLKKHKRQDHKRAFQLPEDFVRRGY